jgi:hypothetical protein
MHSEASLPEGWPPAPSKAGREEALMSSPAAAFDRWTRFRALAGGGSGRRRRACRPAAATVEIDALYDQLRGGRYRPGPLLCFELRDGDRRLPLHRAPHVQRLPRAPGGDPRRLRQAL